MVQQEIRLNKAPRTATHNNARLGSFRDIVPVYQGGRTLLELNPNVPSMQDTILMSHPTRT